MAATFNRSGVRNSSTDSGLIRWIPILIALAIAALLSVSRYVEVYTSQSIGWDSASFLANGAVYSGDPGYTQAFDPTRPPVIPVILSLMFRLTGPSTNDGYVLSALLYLLGILGCYLVAREIMNPWLALLPAASYGVAPMVVEWAGIVYSNVEGTALAALALASLAYWFRTRKPWSLVATLPLIVLAVLTRYTMGVVVFAVVVYLLVSSDARKAIRERLWPLATSFAFASLTFYLLANYWIGFPARFGMRLSNIFPAPQTTNPFGSPLGQTFFAANLPSEMGVGRYGAVITIVFMLSAAYALAMFILLHISKGRKVLISVLPSGAANGAIPTAVTANAGSTVDGDHSWNKEVWNRRLKVVDADPLVYSLITWFLILFLYYSLIWPYYDPRYSVEFVMPALILAFWGINRVLSLVFHLGVATGASKRFVRVTITLLVIALIVFALTAEMLASGTYVVENSPVLDSSVNAGFRQAAGWILANVPRGAHVEGDWYTFLQWYLPQYNITAAPASYQLQSSASYQSWLSSIAHNGVRYVVYSNPSAIQIPPELHEVYRSPIGGVTVFAVST